MTSPLLYGLFNAGFSRLHVLGGGFLNQWTALLVSVTNVEHPSESDHSIQFLLGYQLRQLL